MRERYFSLWIPHLKMMIIGWVNSFKLILPFWILILLLISWMIWTSYLSVLSLSFLNWKMEMKPALPLELVWSLKVIMWGYTQFMKAPHCPTYRRSRINWCQHLAAAKKTVLLRNTCVYPKIKMILSMNIGLCLNIQILIMLVFVFHCCLVAKSYPTLLHSHRL